MALRKTTIDKDANACFAFSDVTPVLTNYGPAGILFEYLPAEEKGTLYELDNDGTTYCFVRKLDASKFVKGETFTDVNAGTAYTIVKRLPTADPFLVKFGIVEAEE